MDKEKEEATVRAIRACPQGDHKSGALASVSLSLAGAPSTRVGRGVASHNACVAGTFNHQSARCT
eukprot:5124957-Prymnesium_polylepis.2